MHKHFDVLTTSSPLSFCENEVSSQSTHFHKLFCFQQFGIFNREKKKKERLKTSCTCKCCGRSFIHSKCNFHWILPFGFRSTTQGCFQTLPWGSPLIASP